VAAERQGGHLEQPSLQRRMLVVAELPFAAPGHALESIDRPGPVEEQRQQGPDREMEQDEGGEQRRRIATQRGEPEPPGRGSCRR
jgi:hypothetical protein